MQVLLKLQENQSLSATDEVGLITLFDATKNHGGDETASSPMIVMLEAMAACSFLDVLAIIKKKRKQVDDFQIVVNGKRAETHPKVFEEVHLHYILKSPDAEYGDLERAMELSQTKYCGASAMFQRSGCKVTWDGEIIK
ncbi:MAG: OsmC family protein [Candidatus Kapabacteria bacterium]|nr:OsmC family protein [Ignavibacteriota bacterium]MCW5885071.1 OsmC family protein [Candidatus Kapabacteria bacterium]